MSDEKEDQVDSIYNDMNKKDRKEYFELKDGKIAFKSGKDVDITKAFTLWKSKEIQEVYNKMTSGEKKHVDSKLFIDKITSLRAMIKKKEDDTEPAVDMAPPEDLIQSNDAEAETEAEAEAEPEEITRKHKKELSNHELQNKYNQLIHLYLQQKPHEYDINQSFELEVRFGTRGIKRLTKTDYDNVVKTLKSFGYVCDNYVGEHNLKIQSEFTNRVTGRNEISNIRTEIKGLEIINLFREHNNIKDILKNHSNALRFVRKSFLKEETGKPVNFDNFNFRVALQKEEYLLSGKSAVAYIVNSWRSSKKTYRFMNRLTFRHPDLPVKVELSLVKCSEPKKTFYSTEEAGLFSRIEHVEIEIEVDNELVEKKDTKSLVEDLKKATKHVLIGLQCTKFPISYPDQREVLSDYMELVFGDKDKISYLNSFIGPSSYTLQRYNIAPLNEGVICPNIRKNYTVTDKADGQRHLLYICKKGKIYLISTMMTVIFVGASTENKDVWNSILDGELILHDKHGKYINLFAAFDIYFFNGKNIRDYPLLSKPSVKTGLKNDPNRNRLFHMNKIVLGLNLVSVIPSKIAPIRVEVKKFYPENPTTDSIFAASDTILNKEKEGLFEYNIDGLIFTPAYFGVGGDAEDAVGPLSKTTWDFSFKYKPAHFNTIDFLVTTVKDAEQDDLVQTIFEEGINLTTSNSCNAFKTVELRCSFVEKIHGYLNPCQDIIDEKFLTSSSNSQSQSQSQSSSFYDAKPVIFYPTKPYDSEAGILKIMLRMDETQTMQMFTEEGEVFGDQTIVEFKYDFLREKGWRWVPLRVRHDKTAELLNGNKNFGNAYHVANSNWQSMHNPVTEEMIRSGLNIPEAEVDEDIYYNFTAGALRTEALKNFHNLFIKKRLIQSVAKPEDTLIDFACGKAGDLSKWIAAKLSFVFGVDISKDNLENRLDGACARYLNARKDSSSIPYCLFVNGNSAYNIRNGAAMRDDKSIQITKAIFGEGSDKASVIGKGVARHYGVASDGFNISSCQFALHYFFKDPETLKGFMRNLAETTKLNGYFIGTAYDGKIIFKMLQNKGKGDKLQLFQNNKKIWELVKQFDMDTFDDTSASIGLRIDVYQESINQMLSEYLINFDYLNRVMENYGFEVLKQEEAEQLGLPSGTNLFSDMFIQMTNEVANNPLKSSSYGKAMEMSEEEKKISFLNRYFVYKKIRTVHAANVVLDMDEYDNKSKEEPKEVKEEKKEKEGKRKTREKISEKKPKIKKLETTLVIEGAIEEDLTNKKKQAAKKSKKILKTDENNEKDKKQELNTNVKA